MTGRASKQKGYRAEREIVTKLRDAGINAERVPLSGGQGGSFTGDVLIYLQGATLRAEVKARGNGEGFTTLERWLGTNDLLFLRRDRAQPLVVMPYCLLEILLRTEKTLDSIANRVARESEE